MAFKLRSFVPALVIFVAATIIFTGCAPQTGNAPGPGTQQNPDMGGLNNGGMNQDNNLLGMDNNRTNRIDNRPGADNNIRDRDNNRLGMNNGQPEINNNRLGTTGNNPAGAGDDDGRYTADENGIVGNRTDTRNNLTGNNNNNLNGPLNGNTANNRNNHSNSNGNQNNNAMVNPGLTAQNDRQRAEKISSRVKELDEVEDANCLVSGNTIIVGYKPSAGSGDINATKKRIIDAVKQIDQNAGTVAVSESGDIMEKIRNLANEITANKPMSEVNQEIRQLLDKINPVTG
jgi:YhcN/YlaJ family sporulation lipoprotein